MKSSAKNIKLTSVDDLFTTEENRIDATREKVMEISLTELFPFKQHPFKVVDDEAMLDTAESIKQYGVLVPAIARPRKEGGYELIAGHRRHRAGIRNIKLTVNGVEITQDKEKSKLLTAEESEKAKKSHTEELKYKFDLNYFTKIVEKEKKKEDEAYTADGKYTIEIEITDNAGNSKKHKAVYYVDKHAPVVDKIAFNPVTSDGVKETSDYIEKLDYGYYFKKDFTATVHVSDEKPSSGLHEVRYRFISYENGKKKEETKGIQKISGGKAALTVPKGFKGQIYVEAYDMVGNHSGKKTTKAYVVDNVAPTIEIKKNVETKLKDAAGNALYTGDNSITVTITDTISGIKEIGYSQSSEQNSYDRKKIKFRQEGYKKGDKLDDGWTVSEVDVNLVTKVTKTFQFSTDDNNVMTQFDATDNTNNRINNVKSEKFTVDKTAPIINISLSGGKKHTEYYNENRTATVTVIERNFDEKRIKVMIENTFGKVPSYSFAETSNTEHVAVIDFEEGDYTFEVEGTDLGEHIATVNYSGGNERMFFVDKSKPQIEENFASFVNKSTANSFNKEKDVKVQIKEHNFDPTRVVLKILRRAPGKDNAKAKFEDVTDEVAGSPVWKDSEDIHTMSFTVFQDGVYQIEMSSKDLAENESDSRRTAVFEIDKTVPVVKSKNGLPVSDNDTKLLDVYTYDRKDEPVPTVEFEDVNLDHIKYSLIEYIPDHTKKEAVTVIKPTKAYLKEDKDKSGVVKGSKVTLPSFKEDGVYELKLTAVDIAGNESPLNVNTYARMVDQDVLAYVLDSNVEQKTGVYSFQYENGDPISKRPDNFDDISVFALAKKDSSLDLVLRDNDGNIINTKAAATKDNSIYGMKVYNYKLKGEFFQENFQDDIDTQLHLSVKNGDDRIDLGQIHIDNIEPSCDVPKELKSWKWYYGNEDRTITLSNIDELIDEEQCKVYDNGKEMPFTYSSETNTLSFTLKKGWHNVGIMLDDMAGNTENIQEKTNIHIGFFWLYMIILAAATLSGATIIIVIKVRRRKLSERES